MISMPTVRLSFSPAPAHVRTARLVGVAMARRAGVPEELLEEIRLAIGEACSRAVALHRSAGITQLVDVDMSDDDRFAVRVTDRAPAAQAVQPELPLDSADVAEPPTVTVGRPEGVEPSAAEVLVEEAVVARMGLALLAGFVDDLEVVPLSGSNGTEVRMSWPLGRVKRDNGN